MEHYKHIDLAYLKSMSSGNTELIKEMIEIFKQQIPEFVADFQKALDKDDRKAIAAIAHKAKSSVSIMGIARMAAVLKDMENKAKEGGDLNLISEWIEEFNSVCYQAIVELDVELEKIIEEEKSLPESPQ
jgi:HPt (histidine-containing phosphotransfer) domain-containing protein